MNIVLTKEGQSVPITLGTDLKVSNLKREAESLFDGIEGYQVGKESLVSGH